MQSRRKTPSVAIGNIKIGSRHPVVIQSMTDTPTSDKNATVAQTLALANAGSEMVRWTINDDTAAQAVPEMIATLRDKGCPVPIVGDFHFNGHRLLEQYPQTAKALAKYRINPGNIGKGKNHDENFSAFIRIAKKFDKPVRIGVNWGSLDEEIFTELMNKNSKAKAPKSFREVTSLAMVESALRSAAYARKLGLAKEKILLSVKTSDVQDMVYAYELLSKECDFALHLGLTEAGSGLEGAVASTSALSILLQQGIGDTIRVSLTPRRDMPRTQEVEVCKTLLQSLGLRYFAPTVISCPGCGRTNREYFQRLNEQIKDYVQKQTPSWRRQYKGIEKLKIAVMGCVVNGPGESRHADIGISLPGKNEKTQALVFLNGKKAAVLAGEKIFPDFQTLLENYLETKFSNSAS